MARTFEHDPLVPADARLRQPRTRAEAVQRTRLIQRAVQMRHEIEIDLNTVAHWNEYVRKPHEAPIDPDPDGSYARMAAYLDSLIAANVE